MSYLKNIDNELSSISEHSIHLYYILDAPEIYGTGPDVYLGDLLEEKDIKKTVRLWIPDDQRAALSKRYQNEPVWQTGAADVGDDLHPKIRTLLSGDAGADASVWRLTDRSKRLVVRADLYPDTAEYRTRDKRVVKQLCLEMSGRARQRIVTHGVKYSAEQVLDVVINDMKFVSFQTGVAILDLCVFVKRSDGQALHQVELVEAVNAFAHFNKLSWRQRDKNRTKIKGADGFSLGDIVRSLTTGMDAMRQKTGRVYIHTFAAFKKALQPDAAHLLAVQLARNYTDDYILSENLCRIQEVRDFETVRHICALEGSCTLVFTGSQNEMPPAPFLENFRQNTFERHYVPLALLAMHERAVLVALSTNAKFWPNLEKKKSSDMSLLEELRNKSLKFQLCYRLSEVSDVSMHNSFNIALRKALNLDRMGHELYQEITEIDGFLREVTSERAEARFRWTGLLGGASLAALTSFTLVKEFLSSIIGQSLVSSKVPVTQNASALVDWIGLSAVAAGGITIVGFVIVSLMKWRTEDWGRAKSKADTSKQLSKQATLRNVLGTARKSM